jgi:uncharacterized SAM-binding protein YcdF (DUF218 family)
VFFAAPSYLLHSDKPIQADVAAVMLGPGFGDRVQKGQRLLFEDKVRYLLIPGRCVVFSKGADGKLDAELSMLNFGHPLCIDLDAPTYRVGTHRELELTREIMEPFGFRSANLVSSPYHMRRIKTIAERVFGATGFTVACISAENNGEGAWNWWQRAEDWWWVSHEYLKLAWFRLYSVFE